MIAFTIAWLYAGIGVSFGDARKADDAREADNAIEIGFAGYVKVGRWTPVTFRIEKPSPDGVSAESIDPEGRTVRFVLSRESADAEATVYRGLCKVGRLDATIRFRGGESPGRPVAAGESLKPLLKQSALLVATLGKPGGFAKLGETDGKGKGSSAKQKASKRSTVDDGIHVVELDSARQLPVDALGYDALDVLVISGKYELDDRRSRALKRWIRNGGHLIFCRGSDLDAFLRRSPRDVPGSGADTARFQGNLKKGKAKPPRKVSNEHISRWLPVVITGKARLGPLDLAGIETFAGARNSAIIFSGKIRGALILDPARSTDGGGTVLVRGDDGPLLVRVAFGFGRITFCGLDFDRKPIVNWSEVGSLARRIVSDAHSGFTPSGGGSTNHGLAQSGTTDLGTQLNSIQQHFPQVRQSSTWKTMGWLLLYVLLIGPVDYILVHRLLRRPRLTWVTFPLMIVAASFLAMWNAAPDDEQQVLLNQLELVDIDATAHRQPVRVNSWLTLLSTETRRYRLHVETVDLTDSTVHPVSKNDKQDRQISSVLSWNGITENVFGGMYRTSGVSFDRMGYTIEPSKSSLGDLPLRVRSTGSLVSTSLYDVEQIVESRLTASQVGELEGTITHHLRAPIDDWILVYRSRIYLPNTAAAKRIAAGVPWSPVGANVSLADLRSTLTGVRLLTQVKTQSTGTRSVSEQAQYDSHSRELLPLVQILSFHETAGGKQYTGLNNHALGGLELTGLLQLQRAVLIGRIEKPASRLMRHAGDANGRSTEIKPRQRHTFVRIVLPVRQSKSGPSPASKRVLKKLESRPANPAKGKAKKTPRLPARAKRPRRRTEIEEGRSGD